MNSRSILARVVNREAVMYGIVGVGTSVLNVGLFKALTMTGMDYRAANLITLLIIKLTVYVLSKTVVFRTESETFGHLAREFGRYVLVRGGTMIIDYVGLILLVSYTAVDKTIAKIIATVVVVVVNYILGKMVVFRKTEGKRA